MQWRTGCLKTSPVILFFLFQFCTRLCRCCVWGRYFSRGFLRPIRRLDRDKAEGEKPLISIISFLAPTCSQLTACSKGLAHSALPKLGGTCNDSVSVNLILIIIMISPPTPPTPRQHHDKHQEKDYSPDHEQNNGYFRYEGNFVFLGRFPAISYLDSTDRSVNLSDTSSIFWLGDLYSDYVRWYLADPEIYRLSKFFGARQMRLTRASCDLQSQII